MFENINEILEHLEFDSEKGIRLLRILTTAGCSLMMYELFGGAVVFPKDLSLKHIADFFFSFQFFIPFLFYYLTWILFKTVLPVVFNLLTRGPFEYIYYKKILKHEKSSVETIKEDELRKVIDFLTNIPTHLGGQKIDFDKWRESVDIDEKYEEVDENLTDSIHTKIESIIFFIQLLLIYYYKLQETLVFTGAIDFIIQFTFIISIVFGVCVIIAIMSYQKLFRVLYKMLKKHPLVLAEAPKTDVAT